MSISIEDNSDFSKIYQKHIKSLYGYGINLGLSKDSCLDIIHDIFCNIYTTKKDILTPSNAKCYLFRSLKNKWIDIQKSKKKEMIYTDFNDLPFSVEVSINDSLIDQEEQKFIKTKVEKLLNSLTNRQREAVYLHYMQELKYDEIGRILNLNTDSVRKLISRGIEKLKNNVDSKFLFLVFFPFIS